MKQMPRVWLPGVRVSSSLLVAPSVVYDAPNAEVSVGEVWKIPQSWSSNEELLRQEDAVAQSLALDPAFQFGRACQFVNQSLWSKTATGAIRSSGRTGIHRVIGMYQHGGGNRGY